MLDLYYAPTPNGLKIRMFMEETGLPHRVVPVNLRQGEQFSATFLAISPNNKIPAIVDPDFPGDAPLTLFESGAILIYLADKAGQLLPADRRGRLTTLQWLFWQTSGLGPTAGQVGRLRKHAGGASTEPSALAPLMQELHRLYSVLDRRLNQREFVIGDYSVADIACYPWIFRHSLHGIDLAGYPQVKRWFDTVSARPATVRAYRKSGL